MREGAGARAGRRLRVAIAEDDEDQRLALEAALEGEGLEVVAFEDGSELLDFVELDRARAPDGIIADLNMPGCSGLAGLERARARGLQIPIFVVTGETSEEVRARVARLANSFYLQKPVSAEKLAQAIYQMVGLVHSRPL